MSTVLTESGSIRALSRDYPILASGTAGYITPTSANLTDFTAIWNNIKSGALAAAATAADAFGYDVVQYTDTETSRQFVLLRERAVRTRYWGLFIWGLDANVRPRIVAQVHTSADVDTEIQSADLLIDINPRAALFTGTHRDASATVDADGSNITDTANANNPPSTIFQAIFEATALPTDLVIEMHGMGAVEPTGSAHVKGSSAAPEATVSTTTITAPRPAAGLANDVAVGDRIYAWLATRDADTSTVVAPAGFTLVHGMRDLVLGTLFEKVATASEPADYTFTWATATKAALVLVNVGSTSGIDVSSVSIETSTTSTPTHTAGPITTTVADTTLLAFYATTLSVPWESSTATGATHKIIGAETAATAPTHSIAVYDNDNFTSPVGTYSTSAKCGATGSTSGVMVLLSLKPASVVKETEIILSHGGAPWLTADVVAVRDALNTSGLTAIANDSSWSFAATGNVQGQYLRGLTPSGRFLHVEQINRLRTTPALREQVTSVITSYEAVAAQPLRVKIASSSDPLSSINHSIVVTALGSGTLTARLTEGVTVRATLTGTLTGTFSEFRYTLTAAEADSIVDYGNLFIEILPVSGMRVSEVGLDLPNSSSLPSVVTASGTLTVSFASTGSARKTASRTGALGVGFVTSGSARKTAARTGTLGVGYATTGVALKTFTRTGTLGLGFLVLGTSRKTVALSGAIGYSLAQTGTARKVSSSEGLLGENFVLSGSAVATNEAHFFTRFEEYGLGTSPADWVDFGPGTGLSTTIGEDPDGERYMRVQKAASGTDGLVWTLPPAAQDVDVYAEFESQSGSTTSGRGGPLLRADITDGSGYVAEHGQLKRARILEYQPTLVTHVESVEANYPSGTRLRLRGRVQTSGTSAIISLKVWTFGQVEPADWTVTFTDATPRTGGRVGWFSFGSGTSATDTKIYAFGVRVGASATRARHTHYASPIYQQVVDADIQLAFSPGVVVTNLSTGDFDDPRDLGTRVHRGKDLHVPMGTPVYAMTAGTIHTFMPGWDGVITPGSGLGYGLQINTKKIRYTYGHLGPQEQNAQAQAFAPGIQPGAVVTKGQLLGWSGESGAADSGPHLHIDWRDLSGDVTDDPTGDYAAVLGSEAAPRFDPLATLNVAPPGPDVPVVVASGTLSFSLAPTGAGGKITTRTGTIGLGLQTRGSHVKRGVRTGTIGYGLATSGTARKTTAHFGSIGYGLATTGVAHKTFARSGTLGYGLATAGAARKTFARSGTIVYGLSPLGTGRKTTARAGFVGYNVLVTGAGSNAAVSTGLLGLGFALTGVSRGLHTNVGTLGYGLRPLGLHSSVRSRADALGISYTPSGLAVPRRIKTGAFGWGSGLAGTSSVSAGTRAASGTLGYGLRTLGTHTSQHRSSGLFVVSYGLAGAAVRPKTVAASGSLQLSYVPGGASARVTAAAGSIWLSHDLSGIGVMRGGTKSAEGLLTASFVVSGIGSVVPSSDGVIGLSISPVQIGEGAKVALSAATQTYSVGIAGSGVAVRSASGTLTLRHSLSGTGAKSSKSVGIMGMGLRTAGIAGVAATASGSIQLAYSLSGAGRAISGTIGQSLSVSGSGYKSPVVAAPTGMQYSITGVGAAIKPATGVLSLGIRPTGIARKVTTYVGLLEIALNVVGAQRNKRMDSGSIGRHIELRGIERPLRRGSGRINIGLQTYGARYKEVTASGTLRLIYVVSGAGIQQGPATDTGPARLITIPALSARVTTIPSKTSRVLTIASTRVAQASTIPQAPARIATIFD